MAIVRSRKMARAYSNDLRRKLLQAFEQDEGTLGELAQRFAVSEGWAKKISAAYRRTGQRERVEQRHGRLSKVTPEVQQHLGALVRQQPDATLAELQARMERDRGLHMGVGPLWRWLRKLGLRLKKNRSTRKSATRRPTGSAAKHSSKSSARLRRRG